MKIQIIVENLLTNPMPGYEQIELSQLSSCAYPSQVDEIYAPTVLNYISIEKVGEFVKSAHKLLSHNGKLIIGGIDCYLLAQQITKRNLTEKQMNDLLFKDPKFKAVHSLQAVKALLQVDQFTVHAVYIE